MARPPRRGGINLTDRYVSPAGPRVPGRAGQDYVSPLLEMGLRHAGTHGPFRLQILIFMERTVALPQRPAARHDGGQPIPVRALAH